MPNPVILFYESSPAPWSGKLKQYCAIRGLRLLSVENTGLDKPLLALLGASAEAEHSEVGHSAHGMGPSGESHSGNALSEPVMVFCHLTSPQLDLLLPELRKLGARDCLKAVLTPTNKAWTLRQLYAELCRERAKMSGIH